MPTDDPPRSLAAREAAELALVRVVYYYGSKPEFILIGGLVPALLSVNSGVRHAGTTDVDVQVDLEISSGAVNGVRLERALRKAEFRPDSENIWRWRSAGPEATVIKFELLADMETEPSEVVVKFDGCDELGAVNLRGTGSAVRDFEVKALVAVDHGERRSVDVNVTGLAGFLVAKVAAARSRRKQKDWYDIAFVLLYNDYGDAGEVASRVRQVFGSDVDSMESIFVDLKGNFDGPDAQGTLAYVSQITLDNPEIASDAAAADCQLAIQTFYEALFTD